MSFVLVLLCTTIPLTTLITVRHEKMWTFLIFFVFYIKLLFNYLLSHQLRHLDA